MYRLCFLFLLLFVVTTTKGQNADTTATARDNKRANKAALYSAILPGAGQVFNKKYWKVPIIYAGAGTLAYFIHTNNVEYKKYKTAITYRNDDDPLTVDEYPRLTNEDLTTRKDYYRRNRDLCYIISVGVYVLNIIDAYVDSQLLNFDVSDKLSLHTSPAILYNQGYVAGLQFNLTFK